MLRFWKEISGVSLSSMMLDVVALVQSINNYQAFVKQITEQAIQHLKKNLAETDTLWNGLPDFLDEQFAKVKGPQIGKHFRKNHLLFATADTRELISSFLEFRTIYPG